MPATVNLPSENILVVKRSLFDELGAFQGLNFEPQRYLGALLSRGNNFFLPRAAAEHDPTHKQIIPYAIIAHRDRVLLLRPRKKSGRTTSGRQRIDRHRRTHER